MEHDDLPLQVGDTVRYDHYAAAVGLSGVVVERLDDGYLCVLWNDLAVPTTHYSHNLRRTADSRRWRH
jgi:hypothetical protein